MKLSLAALPLIFATLVAAQNETLVALRGRPVAAPVPGINYCVMSGNGRNPAGLLLANCRHPVAVVKRSLDTAGEQFALGEDLKEATLETEEALSPDDYTSELEEFEIAEFPEAKGVKNEDDATEVIELGESSEEEEEEVTSREHAPEGFTQVVEELKIEEEATSACTIYRLAFPAPCCPTFYAQMMGRRSLKSDDSSCEVQTVHTQYACPPPVARVADQITQKAQLDLFKGKAKLAPLDSVTVSCAEGGDYIY